MKELFVKLGGGCKIIIGNNILPEIYRYIAPLKLNKKILIVTDTTVGKLYLQCVKDSLLKHDFSVYDIALFPGEAKKTLSAVNDIYETLFKNGFSRFDSIIALGGGIVGDIAGFAASTYMRGIPLIMIPTTVISQTDSALGGKNGVNFGGIKNLIGAFYQPKLVLADTDVLKTLSPRDYANGMAEIIKYACICDSDLFNTLSGNYDLESVIYKCLDIKREIVEQDEKDFGKRHILNFGHTIAHAIEAATKGDILHGEAVAIGMYNAALIGEKLSITESQTSEKIRLLCNQNNLDCKLPSGLDLKKYVRSDKKCFEDSISFVFLEQIGKAVIQPLKIDSLIDLI